MILSRCCKQRVYVEDGDSESHYYVCTRCDRACDTVSSLNLGDHGNDARIHEVELTQVCS